MIEQAARPAAMPMMAAPMAVVFVVAVLAMPVVSVFVPDIVARERSSAKGLAEMFVICMSVTHSLYLSMQFRYIFRYT
jgi:protein-S-isoprenylcysteine O-methyltransferase Ste14